jgi:N-acetylmuramoyl-L-alanine amidase
MYLIEASVVAIAFCQFFLADLRREAVRAGSAQLAVIVQRRLAQARGMRRDGGVRRAPLDVLRDLTMPAVLVEVGYLDHPGEGRALLDARVQQGLARQLAAALGEFRAQSAAAHKVHLAKR